MPTYTGTSAFASSTSGPGSGFGSDSWGGDTYTGAAQPQPWSDSFPGSVQPPGHSDTYTGSAQPQPWSDSFLGSAPPASDGPFNDTYTASPGSASAGPYYDYQSVNVPQQTIPAFGP